MGKGSFAFYVEGSPSVRKIEDERLLEVFILTFGLKLQFFESLKFEMFPFTSIERIFFPVVWCNEKLRQSRVTEKFCPRGSTTFIAGASLCFR